MNAESVRRSLTDDREATLAHIAGLTADLDAVARASADSNLDDEHDPEGSTVAFEREQVAAVREQARAHVADVDAALARLAAGEYGRCESCAGAIAPARLKALPATRWCISCARRR